MFIEMKEEQKKHTKIREKKTKSGKQETKSQLNNENRKHKDIKTKGKKAVRITYENKFIDIYLL